MFYLHNEIDVVFNIFKHILSKQFLFLITSDMTQGFFKLEEKLYNMS